MSDVVPRPSSNSPGGTFPVVADASDTVHVGPPTPAPHRTTAPARATVSRYVVLEEIGRGRMGRVLRAYDPKLQREVALKEVRCATLDADSTRWLVAEARAMAKLSHPNVVAVFDIEPLPTHGIVLVMELVVGQTLKAWLGEKRRASREIVHRFVAAGRGLVAAHAVGLLHRDFKPANVLVSADIVKVTDFGLAQAHGAGSFSRSMPSSDTDTDISDDDRTQPGGVIGTPRYMAPEQHRNAPLTSAADQYAFCVALWEALCGSPPFSGETQAQAQAKEAGPPRWPHAKTPRRIAEAVVRGLSPRPDDRWPSMDGLLGALAWDASRRRHRRVLGGLGVLGLAGVSHGAWADAQAAQCTGAQTQLAGMWNNAERARVQTAFESIGKAYADRAWARTEQALDAYANEWAAMHTEACEATSVRGEQSPQTMDLRMACLHRAVVDLQVKVETLADADAPVVQRADDVLGSLPALDRCADIEALEADVEPPSAEEAEAVEAARLELARARTLKNAGRYEAAQHAVEAAKEALAGATYRPVQTEVALVEGFVLEVLGAYEASEVALVKALRTAARYRQPDEMRGAAAHLLYVVGYRQGHAEDALLYRPLAEGMSRGDPEAEARFRTHLATVVRAQGKYVEAEAEYRAALALWTTALGPGHPHAATSRNNLAAALAEQGRHAEAEAEFRAALALWTTALGPEHPLIATSHNNIGIVLAFEGRYSEAEAEFRAALGLGTTALGPDHPHVTSWRSNLAAVLMNQGEYAEAEAEFRAVLALRETTLGPEHPDVAASRNNIAAVLLYQGKYAEAEAQQRAALALWTTALGPEHPVAASSRHNLAGVLLRRARYAEAEAELRAAVALRETALGPQHPSVASSRNDLASALLHQGKYAEAETEQRAALTLRETALGPQHPSIAESRDQLAAILLLLDRPAEALPLAERAWGRRQQDDIPPEQRAQTAFVLARSLWTVEGPARDHPRARRLAQDAVTSYGQAGDGAAEDRPKVERWLQLHPRP